MLYFFYLLKITYFLCHLGKFWWNISTMFTRKEKGCWVTPRSNYLWLMATLYSSSFWVLSYAFDVTDVCVCILMYPHCTSYFNSLFLLKICKSSGVSTVWNLRLIIIIHSVINASRLTHCDSKLDFANNIHHCVLVE